VPPTSDRYTSYNAPVTTDEGPGPIGYLALVLAWAVPGLGHILIGQRARGIIFMLAIHLLFAAGLLVGGIKSINPPDQAIWTYTQFLTGWPMLVSNSLEKNSHDEQKALMSQYESESRDVPSAQLPEFTKKFIAAHPLFANHPKIQDLGAVYCGIAGMLNLLVMFDVLLRITGSAREEPQKRPAQEEAPA